MARTALILACLLGLGGCEVMAVGFVGANMATLMHTDKTIPDIVLSERRKKNCSLLHVSKNQPYCQDIPRDPALVLADLADNRYCYRTLGGIDCYERPDFLASGQTRINFATGYPPPDREAAAMAHYKTMGPSMAGIPAPADMTSTPTMAENQPEPASKDAPASLMAKAESQTSGPMAAQASYPGVPVPPQAKVPPVAKLPGQGTY